MKVTVRVEQSTIVNIEVPESWDYRRMTAEFSNPHVIATAVDLQYALGDYIITNIREVNGKTARVDYCFPDEVEQLDWLAEAV